MYVVTVAPISRGIVLDELSYFSNEAVPTGALVLVPLRGKNVRAIVLDCVDAPAVKSEVKSAPWSIKRLAKVEHQTFFSAAYVSAVRSVANSFAGTLGATLSALFPPLLFTLPHARNNTDHKIDSSAYFEESIIQDVDEERLAAYKSLIREMFAKRRSIFFLLPSQQDIEHFYASLERGIREYTYVLHGGLSSKELKRRWKEAIEHKHPILIISTPYFLSLPRDDLGVIILDRESSSAYKTLARPFVDLRDFAREFARAINARIVYGDIFLRLETIMRYENGEMQAMMRPKMRLVSTGEYQIVDMRSIGEQPATGRFAIYSPELVNVIRENRHAHTHLFIFCVRRGYAPMTVCGDCGTILHCDRCSTPMVLHGKAGTHTDDPERVFLCHACGAQKDAETTCTYCGGWRMVPLGIGIAQAEEAIKREFPDLTVFRIDGDSTTSHKNAVETSTKFYDTPGSILLGTEMALPYLTREIEHVAILSVNSLLTIPDFRIGERVFRLLLTLRAKAKRSFILQTRDNRQKFFEQALAGNIMEFYREELKIRRAFSLPPYTVLVKISFEGDRSEGLAAMENIERLFNAHHTISFPAFITRKKGKDRMHAIITIPRAAWPDFEIIALLKTLPPTLEVRIDPESVV
jgi:primosomal protein N'